MNYHVKEVAHSIRAPYDGKDAVIPKVGDVIKVTLLNGEESTVICIYYKNNMSGGCKGDTCHKYCSLGRPYVSTCTHLPLKCNDDIMFKNIDDVLEDL